MITILADHRVDHDFVGGHALLDVRGGSGAETTKEAYGLDNCYDQRRALVAF